MVSKQVELRRAHENTKTSLRASVRTVAIHRVINTDIRADARAILSRICGLIPAKSRKNLHCLRGVFVDSKFKRTCIILFLHML